MTKPKLLILLTCLMIAPSVWATGYLEPNIGYAQGSYALNITNSTNVKLASSGFTGGVRFGGLYDYLYLLLDAKVTQLTINTGDSGLSGTNGGLLTTGGFGLGYDWNIPIRTTVIIDIANKIEAYNSTITPTGIRFILSYYYDLGFLINFEYQSATYKTDVTSTVKAESKFQTFFINASFPLEFDYPKTSWKRKVVK